MIIFSGANERKIRRTHASVGSLIANKSLPRYVDNLENAPICIQNQRFKWNRHFHCPTNTRFVYI